MDCSELSPQGRRSPLCSSVFEVRSTMRTLLRSSYRSVSISKKNSGIRTYSFLSRALRLLDRSCAWAVIAIFAALGAVNAAQAQTAHFSYSLLGLGAGYSGPEGVAVDSSGNVYVADKNASAVYEMPAGCTAASCMTSLGGGFKEPTGVA